MRKQPPVIICLSIQLKYKLAVEEQFILSACLNSALTLQYKRKLALFEVYSVTCVDMSVAPTGVCLHTSTDKYLRTSTDKHLSPWYKSYAHMLLCSADTSPACCSALTHNFNLLVLRSQIFHADFHAVSGYNFTIDPAAPRNTLNIRALVCLCLN